MDSFPSKSAVRCQIGRHLAETPYTNTAYAMDGAQGTSHQQRPGHEFSDGDIPKSADVISESLLKKGLREPGAAGSSNAPRFMNETLTIGNNNEFVNSPDCQYGSPEEYEGMMTETQRPQPKMNRRVLTQRYHLDEMRNIKKKISTEDWMYEQLDRLSLSNATKSPAIASETSDLSIDLDELLESGGDGERRAFLESKLRDCRAEAEDKEAFISECVEKIRPL